MIRELPVVRLMDRGVPRVLDGAPGMTFVIDSETPVPGSEDVNVHVRDYRFPSPGRAFQVWTLAPGQYVRVFK